MNYSDEGLCSVCADQIRSTVSKTLDLEAHSLPFSLQVCATFISERLFATNGGFVGAASTSAQPGDSVFTLPGARVPFILRAREDG